MKIYPVGLVGESNYQRAISETYVASKVLICHEIGNPHDELALRVENVDGKVIGYISRNSWLRDAIFGSGRGCAATIREVTKGANGTLGVVINVTLTDDDIPERTYQPESRKSTPSPNPGFGAFISGVLKGLTG